MTDIEQLSLRCIFSEDSRPESSGQTTLVGWYANNVVEMPHQGGLVLLKLCITSIIEMPVSFMPKKVNLTVKLGDATLQQVDIPLEALNAMHEQTPKLEQETTRRGWQMVFAVQFGNFAVKENSVLRIIANVNDVELIGNGLQFLRRKQAS